MKTATVICMAICVSIMAIGASAQYFDTIVDGRSGTPLGCHVTCERRGAKPVPTKGGVVCMSRDYKPGKDNQ